MRVVGSYLLRESTLGSLARERCKGDARRVADGTNFNPVAVSGDVSIAANGAVTIANTAVETAMIAADAITEAKIADDAVESEHINDNVISGQSALTSGLATTDELLISDGGTIKRMDVSVLSEQFASADDVTALAIALG